MKRILQVVGCLELGGTEAFIMNNYRNIDRNKYQFDFLVLNKKDYPYITEIEKLGGKVFYITSPRFGKINKFKNEFKTIIKDNGPYIAIHSHINIANAWILRFAKKFGIKLRISHSHDVDNKKKSLLKEIYEKFERKLIIKNATVFLACSKMAGESLYGEKFFSKHGKVIHNGINVVKFIKEKDKNLIEQLNIPTSTKYVFGNITRFEDKKNTLFIVDVFNEILQIEKNSTLILGGVDGGLLNKTKEKVQELNIQDKVVFCGRRTDMPEILSIIDGYIFPSKFEGLGIVVLEAQASGCECFSSTNVPADSDMEIGNMHFYDLQIGAKEWAKNILNEMKKREKPAEEKIIEQFNEKGYNINQSVVKLVQVYNKGNE